jgi:hypothetical protein
VVDPQSWNRYSYVQNEPVLNIDPTGLFREYPDPNEPDPCAPEAGQSPDGRPPPLLCNVILPEDGDQMLAVITIFGEASPTGWLGTRQYKDGDKVGRPTGIEITAEILENEALLIASVIVNRSVRDHQSLG